MGLRAFSSFRVWGLGFRAFRIFRTFRVFRDVGSSVPVQGLLKVLGFRVP